MKKNFLSPRSTGWRKADVQEKGLRKDVGCYHQPTHGTLVFLPAPQETNKVRHLKAQ